MSKTWSLAALILLAACRPAPALQPETQVPQAFPDEQSRSPVLGLEFWVNGAKSPMRTRAESGRDEVETQIGTGAFEVRFPRRENDVALRMIAWTDRTIFALEPGMKFDVGFLGPGPDMLGQRRGRTTLKLAPEVQNHYVGEQVRMHSDEQEKVLFERVEERADLKADSIFVAAVSDADQDDTVDTGEFEYFNIRLVRG